jgi:hypothetical protein
MKVEIPAKTVEISRCYHECPHFGLEGGPSPTMICNHPRWNDKGPYAGCIISHPECDNGFPQMCPLYKENGIQPPPIIPKKKYTTEDEDNTLSCAELMDITFSRMVDEQIVNALIQHTENINNHGA